jgi:hypothetical protein
LEGDSGGAVNAPNTVVFSWTGRELLVWGGSFRADRFSGTGASFTDGARFNPAANEWRLMSTNGAPQGFQVSAWTERELILYGGPHVEPGPPSTTNYIGLIYNPASDQWRTMSLSNAPASIAVWTAQEMITWGHKANGSGFGVRYNPETDTWREISREGGPGGESLVKTLWTGKEMLWWDDSINWGRYTPATDSWSTNGIQYFGVGAPRSMKGVWTGKEALFWVERTNPPLWRYDPEIDSWQPSHAKFDFNQTLLGVTMVWSGRELIIWHDVSTGKGYIMVGGRYDPVRDTFEATSWDGAAAGRGGSAAAVWTGSDVLLWGGFDGWYLRGYMTEGASYVPELPKLSVDSGAVNGARLSWPYPFADFQLEGVSELGTNLFLPGQVQPEVKGTNWEMNVVGSSNLFFRLRRTP